MINTFFKLFLSLLCLSTFGLNAMEAPARSKSPKNGLMYRAIKNNTCQDILQDIKNQIPTLLSINFDLCDCLMDEHEPIEEKYVELDGLIDEYTHLMEQVDKYIGFKREILPFFVAFTKLHKIKVSSENPDTEDASKKIKFFLAANDVLKFVMARIM